MPLFKRRTSAAAPASPNGFLAYWLSSSKNCPPAGYTRLLDCPEIQGAIDLYARVIGSSTIYLMENRKDGDHRVRDRLAYKIDVDPWRLGTRQSWVAWIVSTMLGEGDGNAFVLPHYGLDDESGSVILTDLEPMPVAQAVPTADRRSYTVSWRGRSYPRDAVLHFRLFPDPDNPWKGRGYRYTAQQLADALGQADALKASLTSPDYKPPIVVYADIDTDFFDEDKREEMRQKYLEEPSEAGRPWILPQGVFKAEQLKPLSLTDLAIKDTSELNRTAVAALLNMPAFLLGVGAYSREQYNTWIKTAVLPTCQIITQTLTRGLLDNPRRYFAMPERRLYAYTPIELVTMGLAMSDRGFMNGDEVRDFAMMDPAGLTEYRALENYIPYDMAALQNKLNTGGSENA